MAKKIESKELFERAQDAFTKAAKEFSERLSEVFGETKDLRHGLETKVEQSTEAFWSALGLATKAELADTQKKVTQLQKRVKELEGSKPTRRGAEA